MKLKKYLNARKEPGGDQSEKNVFLRVRKKVKDRDKLVVKHKDQWVNQGVEI
jgi:hypothetical protein